MTISTEAGSFTTELITVTLVDSSGGVPKVVTRTTLKKGKSFYAKAKSPTFTVTRVTAKGACTVKQYKKAGALTRFRVKAKSTKGLCTLTIKLTTSTFQWNIQVI